LVSLKVKFTQRLPLASKKDDVQAGPKIAMLINLFSLIFWFTVCYAKNFGPTGIGFGGLTQQVEKKE
jgi:hypothetical protein